MIQTIIIVGLSLLLFTSIILLFASRLYNIQLEKIITVLQRHIITNAIKKVANELKIQLNREPTEQEILNELKKRSSPSEPCPPHSWIPHEDTLKCKKCGYTPPKN